jgi:hypothetical protein
MPDLAQMWLFVVRASAKPIGPQHVCGLPFWWTPTMKFQSFALFMTSVVLGANFANAQTCHSGQCPSHCHSGIGHCEAGYHENNLWPAQYIPTARCAVNSAYTAMIANGWRRQNLLGDYHFEEGTGVLTTAGKLKSKWILTQAPQDRRTIYVQRGEDQSETASRIAAVHTWASTQSPVVEPVLVNDTHIVSEGHPAGSVDSIFVGFQANQPAPVLTPSDGSGGGSDSGN